MIPATHDSATQAAVKYAKELDPEVIRSIAVITKIDIQPAGMPQRLQELEEFCSHLGAVGVSTLLWAPSAHKQMHELHHCAKLGKISN